MIILLGFVAYLAILFAIAFAVYYHYALKAQSAEGFLMGNRSVNYWLTALSAHASDMSDWLFMAFPALIYTGGLIHIWLAIGLIIGMFLNWHYVAKPLREATEHYNVYTLSSFFEKKYNDTSGWLRVASACMTLLFFLVYIAAGLKGIGFLVESTFGLPYAVGIVIAIMCVTLYTALGGFLAVAWIDAFQALFLLTMIVLVPLVAFFTLGSYSTIQQAAAVHNISLSLIPTTWLQVLNTFLMAISWALPYMGMPHILTKFMGISNASDTQKAKKIGIVWQLLVLTASTCVGLVGIAFFTTPLINKELIFVVMVQQLFVPLAAGFILCAIAAATLSTVDAQILVLATIVTEDLYKPFFKRTVSNKNLILISRISIVVIACIAGLLSLDKTSTIQSFVKYAWMGLGCSFAPLVLLSLYSNKITRNGALASIMVGGLTAALWDLTLYPLIASTGILIPSLIPGFVMGLLSAYGISKLSK